MKRFTWPILLGVSLLIFSTSFYFLHYFIFRDAHHIFLYLVGDVAFVFIEILLVSLIIQGLLEYREKSSRLEKLNMVIGAFFSEVGASLIETLSQLDLEAEKMQKKFFAGGKSDAEEFQKARSWMAGHSFNINPNNVDWNDLKTFLVERRDFLLRLLENPNLLEHEMFTDLLWAVFHLEEELRARKNLQDLPKEDIQHLSGDVERVYGQVSRQWLKYMEHLERNYPYLFSLALRTNPFDQNASPVIYGA